MAIPIETTLSLISFLLTTIASLRAASRLDARILNNGAIGLMDGPPILGPFDTTRRIGNETTLADDMQISPLWEQCEGFRRAALLGLLFDNDEMLSKLFSHVIRQDDSATNNDEEMAIEAAMEAGLLVPTGGGFSLKTKRRENLEDVSNNNPLTDLATWFIRELSAPFSAIPAWHGMLCSFLSEQRKSRRSKWTVSNIWRRWRGVYYDSSDCDFNALISGVACIPCLSIDANKNKSVVTKLVGVKAYAPCTFRNLRNKCFRVSEGEYARSVLNMMDRAIKSEYYINQSPEEKITMPQILQPILGKHKSTTMQTLPYISFQSNSKGAARAGTFFFFTADGAYMIKTVKKEEAKAFLEMLPKYHRFMSNRSNGRKSLLTRFCGMYSVQFLEEENGNDGAKWNGGLYSFNREEQQQPDYEERVFLVMNSVFPAEASAFITERFDLKGSTVGRECSIEEQKAKGVNAVLKDLNLKQEVDADLAKLNEIKQSKGGKRRMHQDTFGIHIGRRKKVALMTQLKKDVHLLNQCGVLDYSLLIGTADMEKMTTYSKSRSHKFFRNAIPKILHWLDSPMPYHGSSMTKVDGGHLSHLLGTRRGKQVTYYMGIIDFLQPWSMKKRLERDLKGLAGYDTRVISCVAPMDYAERFLKFIEMHVT